jgi:hypothetical protein
MLGPYNAPLGESWVRTEGWRNLWQATYESTTNWTLSGQDVFKETVICDFSQFR